MRRTAAAACVQPTGGAVGNRRRSRVFYVQELDGVGEVEGWPGAGAAAEWAPASLAAAAAAAAAAAV